MLISSDRKFSWLSSVTRSVRTEVRWQECCGVSSVVVNSSSALSRHLQNMVKLDTGNRNPFTAAVQMFPTRRESAGPEPGPESHLDRVQHRHEVIKRFQYFTEKAPRVCFSESPFNSDPHPAAKIISTSQTFRFTSRQPLTLRQHPQLANLCM